MDLPELLEGRSTLVVTAGGQINPNMYAIRMMRPTRLIIFETKQAMSRNAADSIENRHDATAKGPDQARKRPPQRSESR